MAGDFLSGAGGDDDFVPADYFPGSGVRQEREDVRAVSGRSEQALAGITAERGPRLVAAVLGDGVKRLAPSERANYERSNRSLHALCDIQAGDIITKDAFASLRTEKLLRPGLPPSWEERLIGREARSLIPAGEGIRFEDIAPRASL